MLGNHARPFLRNAAQSAAHRCGASPVIEKDSKCRVAGSHRDLWSISAVESPRRTLLQRRNGYVGSQKDLKVAFVASRINPPDLVRLPRSSYQGQQLSSQCSVTAPLTKHQPPSCGSRRLNFSRHQNCPFDATGTCEPATLCLCPVKVDSISRANGRTHWLFRIKNRSAKLPPSFSA